MAYQWADDAIAAIEPLPDSVVKEALKSFAHAVVHRDAPGAAGFVFAAPLHVP